MPTTRFLAFAYPIVLLANLASAQTVSYDLGPEAALLDAAFYAGEVVDGSDVLGRQVVFSGINPAGTRVAFKAVNNATSENGVFLVDVGDPSSWRRLTPDSPFSTDAVVWTPDGSRIYVGGDSLYDATTGDLVYDLDAALGVDTRPTATTQLPSGNWLSSNSDALVNNVYEAWLVPILPNGQFDNSRLPVQVTNLNLGTFPTGTFVSAPTVSRDGLQLAFMAWTEQEPSVSVADLSDVYVLHDIPSIINASRINTYVSTLAPTSLSDPDIVALRAAETPNFAFGTHSSEDGSLVFVGEDFNNEFNDDNFFPSLAIGDHDVVVSNSSDGSDFQIARPGNQVLVQSFPGGSRLLYGSSVGGSLHMFATSLITTTTVSGTTVGPPLDNVLQTTSNQSQADGSGTVVELPTGTTIDFPDGEPQAIVISTPIDPVAEAELPPNAAVDALPVVREFGPDGTTFNPPIEVTITYTDAEIEGMDEDSLVLYLYNDSTNVFDIEVPEGDIVLRDPANNSITFLTDHFSVFGLGGDLVFSAPQKPWTLLVLLSMLGALAGFVIPLSYRARRLSK